MTKGEKIRAARIAKDMTMEELALACGTTKQTIYKYENGTVTNIPSDRLEQICEILDITPSYLFGWEKPEVIEKLEDAAEDAYLYEQLRKMTREEKKDLLNYIMFILSKRK